MKSDHELSFFFLQISTVNRPDDLHKSFYCVIAVPQQTNGCDCGVFVCHYAFALYQQRYRNITHKDVRNHRSALRDSVTNSPYMQFDMTYISDLRKEIGNLVDNLSSIYLKKKLEME
jgi:hypothetical protein